MKKGDLRKHAILKAGLKIAARLGLEAVSIGNLAKAVNMSKSGLFAHFQSKENLQIEILQYAAHGFAENVLLPALKEPAGIPRIKSLVDNWNNFTARITGGCIFVSAGIEFRDRPGRVRDFVLGQQQDWIRSLERIGRSAVKCGVFRADSDISQFAFDLYSLMMGSYYYQTLLRDSQTWENQEEALVQLLNLYLTEKISRSVSMGK